MNDLPTPGCPPNATAAPSAAAASSSATLGSEGAEEEEASSGEEVFGMFYPEKKRVCDHGLV